MQRLCPELRRRRLVGSLLCGVVLLGPTAALSACGSDDDAPAGKQKTVEVAITVKDGDITPKGDRVKVTTGQPIDLVVTADVAGSLHMHSDPEQEFPYEPGTQTIPISIDRPGVIEVESHDPAQIIVQLEVR